MCASSFNTDMRLPVDKSLTLSSCLLYGAKNLFTFSMCASSFNADMMLPVDKSVTAVLLLGVRRQEFIHLSHVCIVL